VASRPPEIGLVLGSGLGGFAESLGEPARVPYADIPHFQRTGVPGHAGALSFGDLDGARVACLSGRVHRYEGHPLADVVFGCRLLAALGCHTVLLTNAAGGIRESFEPGALMLIVDHLNLTAETPLVGPAFVDMTRAYDPGVCSAARDAARSVGVDLHEGVYAGLKGPSYETPAEIRMLRTLGADAVGMSTVMEVIALRHVGVRVGAVSCITNLAAGVTGAPLSHAEVETTARTARRAFESLLGAWIPRCHAAARDGA
jgi:purine-nucleoside phosphorylase